VAKFSVMTLYGRMFYFKGTFTTRKLLEVSTKDPKVQKSRRRKRNKERRHEKEIPLNIYFFH
jgi:hypothetical protein